MANFGWAYIDCTSSANANIYGPTGSLLFLSGSQAATGSQNLIYYTASAHSYAASTLVLTGALLVSGAITASNMLVESITRIDATGSTYFGDTNDDIHMRTGSLYMVGTTAGTGDLYVSGSTTLGGSLSSSNTAIVVGNTVLGSALNVSGNVTLANQISSSAAPFGAILAGHILTSAKIKATGSISGSSTLESVGAATIGGDLYVSGATTLGDSISDNHKMSGSLSVYRDNSNVVLAVDPNTYTTTVMGLNVKYENITTTLQTSSEASYIIGINAGDSDTDYCVMSASTAGIGKLLVIKDEVTSRSGTKIYVSASAGDTIDGAAYYIITGSMASINLYSDGVNKWFIF